MEHFFLSLYTFHLIHSSEGVDHEGQTVVKVSQKNINMKHE
jgi:hypothetical protein